MRPFQHSSRTQSKGLQGSVFCVHSLFLQGRTFHPKAWNPVSDASTSMPAGAAGLGFPSILWHSLRRVVRGLAHPPAQGQSLMRFPCSNPPSRWFLQFPGLIWKGSITAWWFPARHPLLGCAREVAMVSRSSGDTRPWLCWASLGPQGTQDSLFKCTAIHFTVSWGC